MADTDVMTTSLFVNADWSALVPAGSPEAAYGITPKDAKRRGLIPLVAGETLGEPESILASANLLPAIDAEPTPEPEPEEAVSETKEADQPANKEAAPPANKAVAKPANKGAARKDT